MSRATSQAVVDTTRPFEGLLESCRDDMIRLLARYHIPQEDAEDLLQETFVALVFKWENIRNPKAWLLSTLRNRCSLYWRSKRDDLYDAVDAALLDAFATPLDPPQSQTELRHDLNLAISRLPSRYQDLLRLRYGLGCKSSEVAEQMGEGADEIRKLTTSSLVALTRELRRMGLSRDLLHD